MPKLSPSALAKRLRRIRLLVCDVDGVLTDGGVYISESGESKRFSIRDGMGLRCCQMAGIKTAWVSARPSKVTTRRAKELKTDFIAQTKDGKVPAINKILSRTGFTWDEIAMIGDDIVDLAAMAKVGVAVTPRDGCAEAKNLAHFTTRATGGNGAVRELAEKILKAQGKWSTLVSQIAR
jgi:3-deoxy-D-manno-octulosonate 8-phosphate phosphatase (KDO 8-P phosphatase)